MTPSSLILLCRGTEVENLVWSLTSLRSYGLEGNIFTFESGRRGPRGPGVYKFRCSRAQQLFSLVSNYVHTTNTVMNNPTTTTECTTTVTDSVGPPRQIPLTVPHPLHNQGNKTTHTLIRRHLLWKIQCISIQTRNLTKMFPLVD